MRPQERVRKSELELFRQELINLLDQRHALFKLADCIDWSAAVERFGALYSDKVDPGYRFA